MGEEKMTVGKDCDEPMAKYKAGEREHNVSVANSFGVKDPEGILDAHARNIEKWQQLSKDIGRDPDKLADALARRVLQAGPAEGVIEGSWSAPGSRALLLMSVAFAAHSERAPQEAWAKLRQPLAARSRPERQRAANRRLHLRGSGAH